MAVDEHGDVGVSTRMRCWDLAVHCFGTGWIFEQKGKRLRTRLHILSFLSVAVPVTVGGLVMAVGVSSPYLGTVIVVAGIFGVAQLVTGVWSLVARWQERFAYAQESMSDNYRLSRKFERLGRKPTDDLEVQFQLLEQESLSRDEADLRQGVSEKEKRAGLRSGLRKFQRTCVGCGEIPTSMKPTACSVCGNF